MAASTPEEAKANLVKTWEASAPAYAKWVVGNRTMSGLYEHFVEVLMPVLSGKDAPTVLDIAAASGEPALSLAQALPAARITATDISPAYMALGEARVAAAGLGNVAFRVADGERLSDFADASFDAVTISLGVMFMPSHAACLAECKRVLKPGGILALSVWRADDKIPMFRLFLDVARTLSPDIPPAATTTATRFGDPAALLADLEVAGLTQISCESIDITFTLPAEHWWTAMQEMPTPIPRAIAEAEAQGRSDAREVAHRAAVDQMTTANFFLPDGSVRSEGNAAWFIAARAP